jgi:hypothetical protein
MVDVYLNYYRRDSDLGKHEEKEALSTGPGAQVAPDRYLQVESWGKNPLGELRGTNITFFYSFFAFVLYCYNLIIHKKMTQYAANHIMHVFHHFSPQKFRSNVNFGKCLKPIYATRNQISTLPR